MKKKKIKSKKNTEQQKLANLIKRSEGKKFVTGLEVSHFFPETEKDPSRRKKIDRKSVV